MVKHSNIAFNDFPEDFLSDFDSDLESLKLLDYYIDSSFDNSFWKSLICFNCIDIKGRVLNIHIREMWDEKVFAQNLYDQSWTLTDLLKKPRKSQINYKIIIYLCHVFPKRGTSKITHQIPHDFIRGQYWRYIKHVYIDIIQENLIVTKLLQTISNSSAFANLERLSLSESSPEKYLNQSNFSTNTAPLISVITVVLNGGQQLEQTIQSVLSQQNVNLEYIIVDGESSDETVDLIKKYSSYISRWISGKDNGIYDAMNKGIELSTGNWLNFMNSGDIFYSPYSLSSIPLDSNVDFYYSDVVHCDNSQNTILVNCSHRYKIINHQCLVYQKKNHVSQKYLVHHKLTISDYLFFRDNDHKKWSKVNTPLSIYNTEGKSSATPTHFVQKVFVDFIFGDINELQMIKLIVERFIKRSIKRVKKSLKI
jgi:Glycosyl transferase family 2